MNKSFDFYFDFISPYAFLAHNKIKKIGAIGIKVKNWIAYHGFSININNELRSYKKIIACGINNREVTNLKKIKNQEYNFFKEKIIKNFIKYLKV